MTTDALIPVATLVLGWLLNEVSQHLRARHRGSAAAGRALAILLEVRHHLVAFDYLVKVLRDDFQVPAEALPALRRWYGSFLPFPDGLAKQYENAIAELAEVHPVLAFRLQSKSLVPALLEKVQTLARSYPQAPQALHELCDRRLA